ncbi:MAG: DUF4126 domain-containing protein [Actinobacteria bacterium]|nr:DUF4126 domain-containing protein [Actinomycetota bacterium]
MLGVLAGFGLSWAAGLNAYIPALATALIARFTDVVTLPDGFEFLESWWAIGVLVVLLVVEEVLDKVPVVDHVNDAIQTFIRPASGALVFAAGSEGVLENHTWAALAAGGATALAVHIVKALGRGVVNTTTAGVGAPVASVLEDVLSVGASLAALLMPILVLGFIGVFVWMIYVVWDRRRLRRRVAHLTTDP